MRLAQAVPVESHFAAVSRWHAVRPYLLAAAIGFIAKLPTLNNAIIFVDEPTNLAQARRLETVESFIFAFQYRSETKFQLSMVPYIFADMIDPASNVLLVRIFGLVGIMISACLIIALSQKLFKSFIPGFFSLVPWALLLTRNSFTAPPLLEHFQTPIILAGIFFFYGALQKAEHSRRNALIAGFCVAIAALIKPPALLLAPVMCLALVFWPVGLPQRSFGERLKGGLFYALGVIAPLVIFVIPYLFNPTALRALIFNMGDVARLYTTSDNSSYVVRGIDLLLTLYPANFILLVFTLVSYLSRRLVHRKRQTEVDMYQVVLLLCAGALLVGFSTGHRQDHYLIPIMPLLMLFVGYRLLVMYRELYKHRVTLFIFGGIILLGMLASERGAFAYYVELFGDNGKNYAMLRPYTDEQALSRYIDNHTAPTDSIWVYSYAPEIYWYANRYPATIDPTGLWITDYHTQFWYETMDAELVREKPAMIIGMNEVIELTKKAPLLTDLPVIGDLLKQNYTCDSTSVTNVTICARKSSA